MARFIIVRHGHTKGTEKHRYYGRIDMPLSRKGIRQIEKLRWELKKIPIDLIYSSPLRRCLQTARILSNGARIEISKDLREIDFGDWEGLTLTQMQRHSPMRFNDWLNDFPNFKMPGGESVKNMIKRVDRFWRHVKDRHNTGNILIVTHGGPAKVIIMRSLGLQMRDFWRLHIETGSVSLIEDGVVKAINLWAELS